jgi:hypothetical protein
MKAQVLVLSTLLMLSSAAFGAQETTQDQEKVLSGMSIVGNDEAPKSLVIVPWKTSAMGHELDVSRALDPGRRPVDRDVFMRELEYYEIGVESQQGGAAQ